MHNAENLRVVHNPEITKKHRALGNNNYSGTWGFLDFFIVALHRGAFYTPKMRIIHSVSMALCLLAFVSGCSSRLADEEHTPSPKEIAEMRLKADQGDATAQVSLGVMYAEGQVASLGMVGSAGRSPSHSRLGVKSPDHSVTGQFDGACCDRR